MVNKAILRRPFEVKRWRARNWTRQNLTFQRTHWGMYYRSLNRHLFSQPVSSIGERGNEYVDANGLPREPLFKKKPEICNMDWLHERNDTLHKSEQLKMKSWYFNEK